MQEEKKNSVAVFMLLFTALLLVPGAFAQAVEVSNCTGLQNMKNNLSAHYVLTANIDCDVAPFNTGEGFEPIGNNTHPFNGTLDGQGYSISNLFINRSGTSYLGLFGYVENAYIFDLNLVDVFVKGNSYVGSLIGIGMDSVIDNVSVSGEIIGTGWYSGGLTGRIEGKSLINNSFSNIFVNSSSSYVGGLAGFNDGLINNSYSLGEVNIIVPSGMPSELGGLVGYNQHNGTISNSYSHATVFGTNSLVNRVGGLVGYNWGIIDNSYATGGVSGRNSIGGFVGNNRGTILNSHSTGDVFGTHQLVGGFAGNNNDAYINNSYATGNAESTYSDVNQPSRLGGFIGYNSGSTIVENSYSIGNATGIAKHIGGFIGENSGATVKNSYSAGNVYGGDELGGFVGATTGSSVINQSFSTGDVDHRGGGYGIGVGGFVGSSEDSSVFVDSYAVGNIQGFFRTGGFAGRTKGDTQIVNSFSAVFVNASGDNVAGFIGKREDNTVVENSFFDLGVSNQSAGVGGDGLEDGISGKTTSEMRNITTFAEWNISLAETDLNNGYPYLAWQDDRDDFVWLVSRELNCGGEGTEGDPYLICTPYHLHRIRYNLTAHYRLNNSIDLDVAPFNTGEGFEPIGNESGYDPMHGYLDAFRGTFDGAGYNISNLYINRPSEFHVGLFGYVSSSSSSIKNVGIIDANVRGYRYVGALLGRGYGAQVENSFSTGQVYAETYLGGLLGSLSGSVNNSYSSANVTRTSSSSNYYIGGLIGYFGANDVINNSYATGTVKGWDFTGGFIGYNSGGYIYNSYATGDVSGRQRVGGFAGQQTISDSAGAEIYNSYATGDVSTTVLNSLYTGGFIGNHYSGFIYNSYATGNVNGRDETGGFAGRNTGEVYDSYAVGNVSAINYVGGFAGRLGGDLVNVYSVGSVSGSTYLGGLVGGFYDSNLINNSYYNTETSGQDDDDGRGKPKTTAQMRNIATFAEWNISLAEADLNNGYPFLAWQDDRDDFVWLLVEPQEEEEQETPAASGRRILGTCLTEWRCTEWSECIDARQVRNCTLANPRCEPRDEKPDEERQCGLPKEEDMPKPSSEQPLDDQEAEEDDGQAAAPELPEDTLPEAGIEPSEEGQQEHLLELEKQRASLWVIALAALIIIAVLGLLVSYTKSKNTLR